MTEKTEYTVWIKIVGSIPHSDTKEEISGAANHAAEIFFCNVRGEAKAFIDISAIRKDNGETEEKLAEIRLKAIP